MRLDQYLVEHHYFPSRSKAQDAIAEGRIMVRGNCIQKNAYPIENMVEIEVKPVEVAFASRAGFKLYDALQDFEISLNHRIVIDVGASTGGFSDVCLQAGADLIYAVDVGHDQLLKRLQQDPRMVEMSGCNCRYLTKEMFNKLPDFACIDVSFISIKLILPVVLELMDNVEIVALIKPQFEAGRENIGKNGIVKKEKIHLQVLHDMIDFVETQGCYVHHLQGSSILGRDGNKEFIMHIKTEPCHKLFSLKQIVKENKIKR